MDILIYFFAIYGLSFTIKETDGPWNLIGRWRNWMMRLPVIGVQFYNLLNCYMCLGFWCGIIIYLLTQESYKLNIMFVWGLAGGTISLILDGVISFLHRE